jgi:hypothetical protein
MIATLQDRSATPDPSRSRRQAACGQPAERGRLEAVPGLRQIATRQPRHGVNGGAADAPGAFAKLRQVEIATPAAVTTLRHPRLS